MVYPLPSSPKVGGSIGGIVGEAVGGGGAELAVSLITAVYTMMRNASENTLYFFHVGGVYSLTVDTRECINKQRCVPPSKRRFFVQII